MQQTSTLQPTDNKIGQKNNGAISEDKSIIRPKNLSLRSTITAIAITHISGTIFVVLGLSQVFGTLGSRGSICSIGAGGLVALISVLGLVIIFCKTRNEMQYDKIPNGPQSDGHLKKTNQICVETQQKAKHQTTFIYSKQLSDNVSNKQYNKERILIESNVDKCIGNIADLKKLIENYKDNNFAIITIIHMLIAKEKNLLLQLLASKDNNYLDLYLQSLRQMPDYFNNLASFCFSMCIFPFDRLDNHEIEYLVRKSDLFDSIPGYIKNFEAKTVSANFLRALSELTHNPKKYKYLTQAFENTLNRFSSKEVLHFLVDDIITGLSRHLNWVLSQPRGFDFCELIHKYSDFIFFTLLNKAKLSNNDFNWNKEVRALICENVLLKKATLITLLFYGKYDLWSRDKNDADFLFERFLDMLPDIAHQNLACFLPAKVNYNRAMIILHNKRKIFEN